MAQTVFNESYGELTRSLNRTIKANNVSPADYWALEDIYEHRDMDVDHGAIERFIKVHSDGGNYRAPWPFDPVAVVMS